MSKHGFPAPVGRDSKEIRNLGNNKSYTKLNMNANSSTNTFSLPISRNLMSNSNDPSELKESINSEHKTNIKNLKDEKEFVEAEYQFLTQIMHSGSYSLTRLFSINFIIFVFLVFTLLYLASYNLDIELSKVNKLTTWKYTIELKNILMFNVHQFYNASVAYDNINVIKQIVGKENKSNTSTSIWNIVESLNSMMCYSLFMAKQIKHIHPVRYDQTCNCSCRVVINNCSNVFNTSYVSSTTLLSPCPYNTLSYNATFRIFRIKNSILWYFKLAYSNTLISFESDLFRSSMHLLKMIREMVHNDVIVHESIIAWSPKGNTFLKSKRQLNGNLRVIFNRGFHNEHESSIIKKFIQYCKNGTESTIHEPIIERNYFDITRKQYPNLIDMDKSILQSSFYACSVACTLFDHARKRCLLNNVNQEALFTFVLIKHKNHSALNIFHIMLFSGFFIILIMGISTFLMFCCVSAPTICLMQKLMYTLLGSYTIKSPISNCFFRWTRNFWVGDLDAMIRGFNVLSLFYKQSQDHMPKHIRQKQISYLIENKAFFSNISIPLFEYLYKNYDDIFNESDDLDVQVKSDNTNSDMHTGLRHNDKNKVFKYDANLLNLTKLTKKLVKKSLDIVEEVTILIIYFSSLEKIITNSAFAIKNHYDLILSKMFSIIKHCHGYIVTCTGETITVSWSMYDTNVYHSLAAVYCALCFSDIVSYCKKIDIQMNLVIHRGPGIIGSLGDKTLRMSVLAGNIIQHTTQLLILARTYLPEYFIIITEPVKLAVEHKFDCLIIDDVNLHFDIGTKLNISLFFVISSKPAIETNKSLLDMETIDIIREGSQYHSITEYKPRDIFNKIIQEYTRAFTKLKGHFFTEAKSILNVLLEKYINTALVHGKTVSGMDVNIYRNLLYCKAMSRRLIAIADYAIDNPFISSKWPKPLRRNYPSWVQLFPDELAKQATINASCVMLHSFNKNLEFSNPLAIVNDKLNHSSFIYFQQSIRIPSIELKARLHYNSNMEELRKGLKDAYYKNLNGITPDKKVGASVYNNRNLSDVDTVDSLKEFRCTNYIENTREIKLKSKKPLKSKYNYTSLMNFQNQVNKNRPILGKPNGRLKESINSVSNRKACSVDNSSCSSIRDHHKLIEIRGQSGTVYSCSMEVLGEGRYGYVHLGLMKPHGQFVAMKFVPLPSGEKGERGCVK